MEEQTKTELEPRGQTGSSPYYLYTRKKHGLWTSLNMGVFYAVLIAVALWGEEYILLGMTVLLVVWLIYDQVSNPQFLEIDAEQVRYVLPKKVKGEIDREDINVIELSPEQIRLTLRDGQKAVLEINALLSRKKRKELRSFIKNQFEGVREVER